MWTSVHKEGILLFVMASNIFYPDQLTNLRESGIVKLQKFTIKNLIHIYEFQKA